MSSKYDPVDMALGLSRGLNANDLTPSTPSTPSTDGKAPLERNAADASTSSTSSTSSRQRADTRPQSARGATRASTPSTPSTPSSRRQLNVRVLIDTHTRLAAAAAGLAATHSTGDIVDWLVENHLDDADAALAAGAQGRRSGIRPRRARATGARA
jgi:hypothetical protein